MEAFRHPRNRLLELARARRSEETTVRTMPGT